MPPATLPQLLSLFLTNLLPLLFVSLGTTWVLYRLLDQLTLLWVTWRMRRQASHHYRHHQKKQLNQATSTENKRIDNSHLSALLQADQLALALNLTPTSFLTELNLAQLLEHIHRICINRCESSIDELMNELCPERWLSLPSPVQKKVYQHITHHLRPFLDDVLEETLKKAPTLFEFSQTIKTQINHHLPPFETTIHQCLSTQTQRLGHQLLQTSQLITVGMSLIIAGIISQASLELSPAYIITTAALVAGCSLSIGNVFLIWLEHTQPPGRAPRRAIEALKNLLNHQLLDTGSQVYALQQPPKKKVLQKIIRNKMRQWFVNTLPASSPTHYLSQWLIPSAQFPQLYEKATEQCLRALDVPLLEHLYCREHTINVDKLLSTKLDTLNEQTLKTLLKPMFQDYQNAWYLLILTWTGFVSLIYWFIVS